MGIPDLCKAHEWYRFGAYIQHVCYAFFWNIDIRTFKLHNTMCISHFFVIFQMHRSLWGTYFADGSANCTKGWLFSRVRDSCKRRGNGRAKTLDLAQTGDKKLTLETPHGIKTWKKRKRDLSNGRLLFKARRKTELEKMLWCTLLPPCLWRTETGDVGVLESDMSVPKKEQDICTRKAPRESKNVWTGVFFL